MPPALADLEDLRGQGGRITRVAGIDLHGYRTALRIAQEAHHDLQPVLFLIAAVPELRQRAGAALEVGRGDVVEQERTLAQVPLGQPGFDLLLPLEQPVHGGVELIGRRAFDREHLSKRAGGRLGIEHPSERKARGRLEDAGRDECGRPGPARRSGGKP